MLTGIRECVNKRLHDMALMLTASHNDNHKGKHDLVLNSKGVF